MKIIFAILLIGFFAYKASAQHQKATVVAIDTTRPVMMVDASCGQCKFALKGKGCNLAVRINDKAYFVDGTAIDDHGDAHANDGFCNKIRKAKVQGEVVDGRFKATYFQLLPEVARKKR